MADHSTPFQPQDPGEINGLIEILNRAQSQKKSSTGFFCKKKTYQVEGSPIPVDSWKFLDHEYKKKVLPTFARGLFTCKNPATGDWEIASRGYDKFFNIDEVERTKWTWIKENTKGPYEVTVKENGCIIFISGLPDDTLLVCSKHSVGPGLDPGKSHAFIGETWVDQQLEKVGKSKTEFSRVLREANVTAVAELCDDAFEEHILPYEGDHAGLYLHGVNLRLPKFSTYSAADVKKFAQDWGFKVVGSFDKPDVQSLRDFLEEVAETGSWDGKDVEGFVIRCKARDGPDGEWHDWFFKYKFEEPYLMYRLWRECTKAIISGKEPKFKKHTAITAEYLKFAEKHLKEDPEAAERYRQNHGIIKLRNAFLEYRGQKGSDIIREEVEDTESEGAGEGISQIKDNVVLVPIATLGCGKTTIANALHELFGWGHIQNDNIGDKRGKMQEFANTVSNALRDFPVVFADRNNHQYRERQQIIRDVSKLNYKTTFVALHYVHSEDLMGEIENNTMARVFGRGDNHQTIRAATQSRNFTESIMKGFLQRFQGLDTGRFPDSGFNAVIDLDPLADSRENLETVVSELKRHYPKLIPELPTSADYDRAISAALNYAPSRHTASRDTPQPSQPKVKPKFVAPSTTESRKAPKQEQKQPDRKRKYKAIDYFGIFLPFQEVYAAVDSAFEAQPERIRGFWKELNANGRVQETFHVTLCHASSQTKRSDVWKKYTDLLYSKGDDLSAVLGRGNVELHSMAWNGRVMAVRVLLPEEWDCANDAPHTTIGTANPSIKPVESNKMLEAWSRGDKNILSLELQGVVIEGEVKPFSRR
ncbi:tRNA ligase [Choiromyces venosus 120613-1]|uniref:tRNA ligase n=1 Tax=Choiromyces venosus 120613-1 TaxID=1336337 RepID=A0A3N4IX32_9PEZI|nr:tRNA ligase [Choiromyces venosus 120613-1]